MNARAGRRRAMGLWLLPMMLVVLALAPRAVAHPLAPALLELHAQAQGQWQVLWRVSRAQPGGVAPTPVFPPGCQRVGAVDTALAAGTAITRRWRMDCGETPLPGATLGVAGLENSPVSVIVRVHGLHSRPFETLLWSGHAEYTLPVADAGVPAVFARYLQLGADHLLGGPDHLLFLAGLMLLATGWRRLVLTLTAFTLGHSLTLSLAALGWIVVNPALMELAIALSLVVVARELLSKRRSALGRRPATLAFAFGLLHGLGFAGTLVEAGLPRMQVAPALLAFNLGIELAQLLVVAVAFAGLVCLRHSPLSGRVGPLRNRSWIQGVSAYAIGGLAAMWCLQRVDVLL